MGRACCMAHTVHTSPNLVELGSCIWYLYLFQVFLYCIWNLVLVFGIWYLNLENSIWYLFEQFDRFLQVCDFICSLQLPYNLLQKLFGYIVFETPRFVLSVGPLFRGASGCVRY